eukprot:s1348_g3.t1
MGYRVVARVARNVRLADMNLDVPVADERRIEVVANGLPMRHGSQLALDAQSCPPSHDEARPTPALTPCQAAQAMLPGASITALTPNSAVPDDAALSPSAPRLAAGSTLRQSSSCASWRGIAPPPSPRTGDIPATCRDSLLEMPRQPILAMVRGQSCTRPSRKRAEKFPPLG